MRLSYLAYVSSLLGLSAIVAPAEGSLTVCAIGTNNIPYRWDEWSYAWRQIGGTAGKLYGGQFGLFATNLANSEIWRYNNFPGDWTLIGGGGANFVVTKKSLYGLSLRADSVFKWNGGVGDWSQIGGAAREIYGGGDDTVLAENANADEIWLYENGGWTRIGNRGYEWVVGGGFNWIYGLASDKGSIWLYNGQPDSWKHVGGAGRRIFGGSFGVYSLDINGLGLWQWSWDTHWDVIGGGGADFAVGDESVFGLSSDGTVYEWEQSRTGEPGFVWNERRGISAKSIVVCP
ncbi:hypothetical protein HJFPF1_13109 [Paramyrothecium foliicola]|nr:hypothetical protein HJFPF1_13109 [Paramyrothecium foliicola]